ncbi:MAG: hypothetical protein ACJ8AD_09575, partial [Gemmatimonadaceae bacterium]
AWHWGYIIQPPVRMAGGRRTRDDALSLVYGQVSNGVGAAARHDHALGVWTGKRCRQIFFDDAVRITSSGTLTGTTVPRVPGVVALLSPGRPHDVPRQIAIHAHDGDDSVDIELDVDGAMQFLIPRPDDIGSTTITELVGEYTVRTMLGGSGSEFSYRGFAEVAR